MEKFISYNNDVARDDLQNIKTTPPMDQTLFDVEQDEFIVENQVKDNVSQTMTQLYKNEYRKMFEFN